MEPCNAQKSRTDTLLVLSDNLAALKDFIAGFTQPFDVL
jgi:hypothetical protein